MKEVRRAALQAQKNCKETLPRARRLTKEMLLYWKKYEKVEKEQVYFRAVLENSQCEAA